MTGFNIWLLEATCAISFVIGSVSSYPEQCINGSCFKTPGSDVRTDFNGAKSWCAKESSQLAVVRDSETQQILTQFLSSSQLNEPAFINIRLYERSLETTWFLVNGSKYLGGVSNQETQKKADYALYSCLNYSLDGFMVTASKPNQVRSYICEFRDTSFCSTDSTNDFIYNGSCYIKYDNEALTWFQARERCHNNSGDLATFNYVNGSYTSTYPPFNTSWLDASLSYWVGIRWQKWLWKSPECGDEIFYTTWSPGTPNNTDFGCVCVDPNGNPSFSWVDCHCDIQRQFVCLKIAPSTSSQGLTDAMLIGLVLGIGVNLPLLIIILVLVIIIVRQRRRSRKKTRNGKGAGQSATTPRELETDVGEPGYAHLRFPRSSSLYSPDCDLAQERTRQPGNNYCEDFTAHSVCD